MEANSKPTVKEAWQIVYQDFLKNLDHSNQSLTKAIGDKITPEKQKNRMIKMNILLNKVVDNEDGYDCVSRQIEYLIMDCDSLAEAIHNVHTFTAAKMKVKMQMESEIERKLSGLMKMIEERK